MASFLRSKSDHARYVGDMTKTEIIERLGEAAVLLPSLIADALAANDRLKLRLSLLQDAATHAIEPHRPLRGYAAELRAHGLDDPRLETLAKNTRLLDRTRLAAPGTAALIEGIGPDLELMLAPLTAARTDAAGALEARVRQISGTLPQAAADELDFDDITAMTAAQRGGTDSVHLLVMDLHKAINRLAAETAVEDIDGAKVHHLDDDDRPRIKAFMNGLNRTAPLAFGHPGLGTTAARSGARLTIQNDIGETDAHVLVIHVDNRKVTVTYTDVHRRRARFFMSLFEARIAWSPLAERSAEGMPENNLFHLVTGSFEAPDLASLDDLLKFLGSRMVFLIDWNKARKALRSFVGKSAAIDLLEWAAAHDYGHRGFLVLGGADLVLDIVRRAAAARVPYGIRLDEALGSEDASGFLQTVLRETSAGLQSGSSARLIRDDIQADLMQRFETAESAILSLLVRHLGLSRMLAAATADVLTLGGACDDRERGSLAERAKRLESKADLMTMEAREACDRLQNGTSILRMVEAVEDTMDALDECAFLVGLDRMPTKERPAALDRLADIVVDAIGQLVRATEAASRLPGEQNGHAATALQAIDRAIAAERLADNAERDAIASFMRSTSLDARALVRFIEVTRALERASDHVAHAAHALRARLLEELVP